MNPLTMLPYYLFSNFHCFGMCGPIAALVGRSPFWGFYLAGRIVGFTFMGMAAAALSETIAWEMGNLRGILSVAIGIAMLAYLVSQFRIPLPGLQEFFRQQLGRQNAGRLFLIGMLTPLLPCGQSLMLFAFCAILGQWHQGMVQGLLFSAVTTPSLLAAIKGVHYLVRYQNYAHRLMQGVAGCIAVLTVLRGLAELEVISHYSAIPTLHLSLW